VPEIRLCAGEHEKAESLAIYNEVWPLDAITMDELRVFESIAIDCADFLVRGGSGWVGLMPRRPDVGLAFVTVLPRHRRRGLGAALYARISAWLAEQSVVQVDATVPEDDEQSLEFALKRGFREVERNRRMILELCSVEPGPVAPPEGIEIVTWAERPDLTRGIYEVACEAEPDVPGDREAKIEPFEDWLQHEMQGPGDQEDATFLALRGDDVVGYAKFSLTAAQPESAHHDMTGVKRAWRGRGVAEALKRRQIAWAKEHGYRRLVTQNEMRNEPIRRLNQRLGYREAPGRIVMRGPLA
jgi:GNAT superfamily N-acetyltransferase